MPAQDFDESFAQILAAFARDFFFGVIGFTAQMAEALWVMLCVLGGKLMQKAPKSNSEFTAMVRGGYESVAAGCLAMYNYFFKPAQPIARIRKAPRTRDPRDEATCF